MLVKAKDAVKQPYGFLDTGANSNIAFVSRFAQGFGR
jgi:hypothetical protein